VRLEGAQHDDAEPGDHEEGLADADGHAGDVAVALICASHAVGIAGAGDQAPHDAEDDGRDDAAADRPKHDRNPVDLGERPATGLLQHDDDVDDHPDHADDETRPDVALFVDHGNSRCKESLTSRRYRRGIRMSRILYTSIPRVMWFTMLR